MRRLLGCRLVPKSKARPGLCVKPLEHSQPLGRWLDGGVPSAAADSRFIYEVVKTPICARDGGIGPRPRAPTSMVPGHSIHGGCMPTESINRRLSRWVAGLSFPEIPPAALDRARGVTLQGLSSGLLG